MNVNNHLPDVPWKDPVSLLIFFLSHLKFILHFPMSRIFLPYSPPMNFVSISYSFDGLVSSFPAGPTVVVKSLFIVSSSCGVIFAFPYHWLGVQLDRGLHIVSRTRDFIRNLKWLGVHLDHHMDCLLGYGCLAWHWLGVYLNPMDCLILVIWMPSIFMLWFQFGNLLE